MNYIDHVSNIVSSCTKALVQINKFRYLFRRYLFRLSKLYDCSSVWISSDETNIKRLQSSQNFAVRIMTGTTKFENISSALKGLKWLPVAKELYIKVGYLG